MTSVRSFVSTALACAAALILSPSAAAAKPSLEQTVSFTRAELSALCTDAKRSGIEAIDRLAVGGGRNCNVILSPGKLQMSVRQRGAARSGGVYARLELDVAFNRDSGFICGPKGRDGRSTLFVTCKFSSGADGPICAERSVTVAQTGRDDYKATQMLAAASILRTDSEACGVVARALTYISERSGQTREQNLRDFFSR